MNTTYGAESTNEFNKGYEHCQDVMRERSKYNGWSNYATWRVNLEIVSDLEVDSFPQDQAGMADALKDYIEDYIIESTENGIAQDYALAFLGDVNWYELAEHKLEDVLA